jgi:capsular polysaccharide biosynthesis protein
MEKSSTKIYLSNQRHSAIGELCGAIDDTDIPEMVVETYSDALLTPSNHVFVKGRYVPTGIINPFDDKKLTTYKSLKLYIKSAFILEKVYHKGTYLFVTDALSYNYYHWICEALPRLLMMTDRYPNATVILPKYLKKYPLILDTLHILEWKSVWIDTDLTNIFATMVTVQTNPRYAIVDPQLQQRVKQLLFKNIAVDVNKAATRKIYISRSKSVYRKIKNEENIVSLVKSRGYEVLYAEDYTFAEQVNIFNETKYLIAMHGAGLTNTMFMQPDSNVLEIRIDKWMEQPLCFWRLANMFMIRWSYFLTPSQADGTNFTDVYIDEQTFAAELKAFDDCVL